MSIETPVRLLGKCLSVGLLLLATGCAGLQQPKITQMVWPEPPLEARIQFEGLLRNGDDLGQRTKDIFKEALFGLRELPNSLQQPMGVALSPDGKRLYVTDYIDPHVYIFDFEKKTMAELSTDQYGFQAPLGVAVDKNEDVYVVDSKLKLVRVFDVNGEFQRDITHESLERPTGIALDEDRRRIYVADSSRAASENHAIRVFDFNGTYQKAIGTQGNEPGEFLFPSYLTVDKDGHLYVTDTLNGRVQVLNPDGEHVKTIGERGDAYGMFDKPKGVALDQFGNVYVVDSGWSNVQIFNQRGDVLLFFGGRGKFPGLLFNPTGIAIDPNNRIYVADAFNGRVGIYQLMNTKAEDSFVAAPEPNADPDIEATAGTTISEQQLSKGGE